MTLVPTKNNTLHLVDVLIIYRLSHVKHITKCFGDAKVQCVRVRACVCVCACVHSVNFHLGSCIGANNLMRINTKKHCIMIDVYANNLFLLGKRDKKTSPGLSKWITEDVCWASDRRQITHHWKEL